MARGLDRRVGGGRRDRDRRRVRARRGVDGRGRRALRLHDDVALPARVRQGRARAADARRARSASRPPLESADWRDGPGALVARDARGPRPPPVGHRRPDHRDARHRRASSPGSTAASRRSPTTALGRRLRRPRSSCCVNGYVFWAARLRFQVPDDATPERRPAAASTSSAFPSLARARGGRGSSRTSIDARRGLRVRPRARPRRDRGADRPRADGARRLTTVPSRRASSSSDRSTSTSSSPSRACPRRARPSRAGASRARRRQVGQPGRRRRAAGRGGVVRRRGRRRTRWATRPSPSCRARASTCPASRGVDAPTGVALIVVDARGREPDRGRLRRQRGSCVDSSTRRSTSPGRRASSCSATRSRAEVVVAAARAAAEAAGWPRRAQPGAGARRCPTRRSPCSRRTPPRPPSSPAATTRRRPPRALVASAPARPC